MTDPRLEWLEAACQWEVLAPKAGNVHPGADFDDMTCEDFLRSARIVREYYEGVTVPWDADGQVSKSVLEVVKRTKAGVGRNTNLGIVLLLAPLLAVPLTERLDTGIGRIIERMGQADSARLYQAIREAHPGGLGQRPDQDVNQEPTLPVREVMRLAEDHDLVARQYARNFADILNEGVGFLDRWWKRTGGDREKTVVGVQLEWMSGFPDSLIRRKRGLQEAEEAAEKSREVLRAGWPETESGVRKFSELDQWMRAEKNQRNPGTSADLVAATLYVGFREGVVC